MRVICQCAVLVTIVGAVPMMVIGCAGGSEKERSEKTVPAGSQPPPPDSSVTLPKRAFPSHCLAAVGEPPQPAGMFISQMETKEPLGGRSYHFGYGGSCGSTAL